MVDILSLLLALWDKLHIHLKGNGNTQAFWDRLQQQLHSECGIRSRCGPWFPYEIQLPWSTSLIKIHTSELKGELSSPNPWLLQIRSVRVAFSITNINWSFDKLVSRNSREKILWNTRPSYKQTVFTVYFILKILPPVMSRVSTIPFCISSFLPLRLVGSSSSAAHQVQRDQFWAPALIFDLYFNERKELHSIFVHLLYIFLLL